jgi:hypothetical protein
MVACSDGAKVTPNTMSCCPPHLLYCSSHHKVYKDAENRYLRFKGHRPFNTKKRPAEQWQVITNRLIPLSTQLSLDSPFKTSVVQGYSADCESSPPSLDPASLPLCKNSGENGKYTPKAKKKNKQTK